MAVINYSSYAQAIEKGMSKRNMTGMAKVLFAFMCDHEDVVRRRNTKADEERGNMDVRYHVPDGEAIEWFRGQRDVSETLRNGAGNNDIIAEAPEYFEKHVLNGLINPQKEEQAIKAVRELEAVKKLVLEGFLVVEIRDGFSYRISDLGKQYAKSFESTYAIQYRNNLLSVSENTWIMTRRHYTSLLRRRR